MPVRAQDKSTYYTIQHPDEFSIDWASFYERMDEMTAQMRRELTYHLNLPFGQHPKQRLDLYLPRGEVQNAPVFIFFHGGGFREGDRAHYGAVARGFSQHGIITAVAGYRLTSQGYQFPDQAEDARRALAWVYRHIRDYGGDPDRIFVGGHSAGAFLTAEVTVKADWLDLFGLPKDLIKGAIPVSGRYDRRLDDPDFVRDDALRKVASPIENISNTRARFLVAVGSPEKDYVRASREFVDTLHEKGAQAEVVVLPGLRHDQTALSLCNPESELFRATLELIQSFR